jgi:integrase
MPRGFAKCGLTYALKYATNEWKKGIGKSKREIYLLNNNGRSPYIHSHSTFNRYSGIAKDFVAWAKENGINRLHRVSYDHVRDYLEQKIEKGYSERTIKLNASALKKFFETVGRQDIAEKLSDDYQRYYSHCRAPRQTRGFSNPYRVINNLKDEVHKTIAELQLRTGARVGDVKKIKIDYENQRVIIPKSKGGRTRVIDFKELSKYDQAKADEFERIAELKEKLDYHMRERDWKEIRGGGGSVGSYYKDLRRAVKMAGETYGGAHAFRASYAERFWEWAENQGWEREQIERVLEEHLGHSRVEWSRHYAGR